MDHRYLERVRVQITILQTYELMPLERSDTSTLTLHWHLAPNRAANAQALPPLKPNAISAR